MNTPSRRQFVKVLTLGTASAFFLGKPWRRTVLAEGQPAAIPGAGAFSINLNDYPTLLSAFGSVRLGVNPMFDYTTPDGAIWPIVITRVPGNVFFVVDSACTHAGCAVPPYDLSLGLIECPCHGSKFDYDGTVLDGPASSPLASYPNTFDGVETLTIQWPGLGFRVNATVPPGGVPAEIHLSFETLFNVEYEVRYRQRLQDPWVVVPFSISPGTPPDRTSLVGNGAPALAVVPVTAPTGFYAAAIKLLDVS
jgi:Rieske Fe-S protein